jgi:hypothetical protein
VKTIFPDDVTVQHRAEALLGLCQWQLQADLPGDPGVRDEGQQVRELAAPSPTTSNTAVTRAA